MYYILHYKFDGRTVYYGVVPKKISNSTFENKMITSKLIENKNQASTNQINKINDTDNTENFFIPPASDLDMNLYVRDFDHEFRREDKVLEMYFKATIDEGDPRSYKPTTREWDKIEEILIKPNFATLDPKEKNLIWKYRYSLVSKPEALPKVLKTDFSNTQENEKELVNLIKEWSKIKYEDAIYLLSRDFTLNNIVTPGFNFFKLEINIEIRKYAVDILKEESAENLGNPK